MNEVVIGAPYCVTKELMDHFNVSVVCHGQTHVPLEDGVVDPYAVPKKMGKFVAIDSGINQFTEKSIGHRLNNFHTYSSFKLNFQQKIR